MLLASIRDLIWRRRRFAIALVATALVMSMSLVMSGLSASFPNEIDRTLDALDGGEGTYLAVDGANGPFYPGTVIFGRSPVEGGGGVLFASATVPRDGKLEQATVLGVEPGLPGDPTVDRGAPLGTPGDAVVSSELGLDIGDTVVLATTTFRVGGVVDKVTLFGGQPVVFLSLTDAQKLFVAGQAVSTFVLAPPGTDAPDGFVGFDQDGAFDDLIRPLKNAQAAILFVTILLWIVAACIVGSVVFLSAMERTRDFAVFKATGASTSSIAGGLMIQAAVIAVAGSLLAILLALVLAPMFPMPVEIPGSSMIRLPLLATVVGIVASLAGLRRVLSVPPSMAFGGAS
jgi:putative ABC transport system permease protein